MRLKRDVALKILANVSDWRRLRNEAFRRSAELLESRASHAKGLSSTIAQLFVAAGDNERAIAWLQRGVDGRDRGLATLKTLPVWDPLHRDPRFQELLRRMKLS